MTDDLDYAIADRIMARVERDGAIHRDSLAEEAAIARASLVPAQASTSERQWRLEQAASIGRALSGVTVGRLGLGAATYAVSPDGIERARQALVAECQGEAEVEISTPDEAGEWGRRGWVEK